MQSLCYVDQIELCVEGKVDQREEWEGKGVVA